MTALFSIVTVGAGVGTALYLYYGAKPALQAGPLQPQPSSSLKKKTTATTGHDRSYLGVFERGATASYQPVADFASAVGQKPNIVSYYNAWGGVFELNFAERAAAHGAIPMVQLMPVNVAMQSIADGHSDSFLRSYAQQVRAYANPVIISFAPEANGRWYKWGWTHTPPQVWIAAWRHVVTLFRKQGATNVTWLWTMNRTFVQGAANKMGPFADYWPGAAYVNWVGIDGYYFTSNQDFSQVFGPTITAIRAFTNKPIFLSEVAIGQIAGQARMIPNLFAGIRKYHLIGLLWFDVAQQGGTYHQDWRLEGHPSAITAFRQGLRSISAP